MNGFEIKTDILREAGLISTLFSKKVGDTICKAVQPRHICARKFCKNIYGYPGLTEQQRESRLKLLHFEFVHNIYQTNVLPEKHGMRETNKCTECQETDYSECTFDQCY